MIFYTSTLKGGSMSDEEFFRKFMSEPLGTLAWREKLRIIWAIIINKKELDWVSFVHRDGYREYLEVREMHLTWRGLILNTKIDINRPGDDAGADHREVNVRVGFFSKKALPIKHIDAFWGSQANWGC